MTTGTVAVAAAAAAAKPKADVINRGQTLPARQRWWGVWRGGQSFVRSFVCSLARLFVRSALLGTGRRAGGRSDRRTGGLTGKRSVRFGGHATVSNGLARREKRSAEGGYAVTSDDERTPPPPASLSLRSFDALICCTVFSSFTAVHLRVAPSARRAWFRA